MYTYGPAFSSQLCFPRLTRDALIQIPVMSSPLRDHQGAAKSLGLPEEKLATASKRHLPWIQGRRMEHPQASLPPLGDLAGCCMHSFCCRSISGSNEESACQDAQKVMEEDQEPPTDFPAPKNINAGNASISFLNLFLLPRLYSRGPFYHMCL